MKLLIVEDEDLLVKHLVQLITNLLPEAVIAGSTKSITATVQWLNENEAPDLIFMDIELADGQCFDIFQQCSTRSPIIFTTAYDEFALRAFKLNSIDYLLKPIKEGELKAALQKWKDTRATAVVEHASISKIEALLQELRTTSAPSSFRDQFLVRKNQKMVPVDINHIGYFSSKSSLTYFITKMKQKHFIDYTLDEVERMVDSRKFNRVNRQFIVAKDMVSAVQPWFNGKLKLDIQLPVEEDIIVSRDKAPVVKEWLGA